MLTDTFYGKEATGIFPTALFCHGGQNRAVYPWPGTSCPRPREEAGLLE